MQIIKRALISLTDKSGIETFAAGLVAENIEILSTGGTAGKLREQGIDVIDVSDFTGFPEMLDGRVKTLHPKVHGGILHQRANDEHLRQCREHGLLPIDLVAVNLYAFENIDIGGPTLLRAAAKNFQDVTVVVDPADYDRILTEIKSGGNTTLATRFHLARKVFELTSRYDTAIARWLGQVDVKHDDYFKGV
jgi:phosphoribosylaminoimidazolecarboxamide formyltransferase/IMP cyclohydrolase